MALAGGAAAMPALTAMPAQAQTGEQGGGRLLPVYARAMNHKSLKQSSYDTTGNSTKADRLRARRSRRLTQDGCGSDFRQYPFTIAAPGLMHLKELVLRAYWDGATTPSVQTPIGDFFGLNLGDYVMYESDYLGVSPGKSLNCYFAMPYRTGARMTVTNEGRRWVRFIRISTL